MTKQANTTAKAAKTGKSTKAKSLASQLTGLQLLGEIVTWNARSNVAHKHSEVVAALEAATLDPGIARELLPRFAFGRASKKLTVERLIDVLREDENTITFQFTKKAIKEDAWEYAKETLLELNKTTGKVSCPKKALEELAQSELDRCMEERTTNDITKIVQRCFDKEADLFPIRDQGGVYFVPIQHTAFIAKVDLFLTKLGGRIDRFPVPAGTQAGDKAVQNSVADSLASIIRDHELAVDSFTLNTRKDTIEHAAEKINATRVKIEAYANYLADRREEMLKAIEAANQKLLDQVNKLSGIRASMPAKAEGDNTLFGFAPTAVIRWMAKQGWKFDQVEEILKGYGISVAEATIRTQLQAGKSGRGDPAAFSAKQAKELTAKLNGEAPKPVAKKKAKKAKKTAVQE